MPYGPYVPVDTIVGSIPRYPCCPPCTFHIPTAPSIHIHGSVSRRPIHPQLQLSLLPFRVPRLPRMCSISSCSPPHPHRHLWRTSLELFTANGYIVFDYIPQISNFYSLDHEQKAPFVHPSIPYQIPHLHDRSVGAGMAAHVARIRSLQFIEPYFDFESVDVLQDL